MHELLDTHSHIQTKKKKKKPQTKKRKRKRKFFENLSKIKNFHTYNIDRN